MDITVLMSVYNDEKYVSEAVESVLCQTYSNFEFIIVNDGSTDGSEKVLKSYKDKRIKLLSQSNQGLAKSLNNGLNFANGKYIARIDADDICHPKRLEFQYKFLENNTEYVAVGSNADLIDMNGNFIRKTSLPLSWIDIKKRLPMNPFMHSSVMFKKKVALKCGNYFEPIKQYYEDVILWNKLSIYGKLKNLEKSLIRYRIKPSSISLTSKKLSSSEISLINGILNNDFDKELFENIINNKQKNVDNGINEYYLVLSKLYFKKPDVSKSRFYLRKILKNGHYNLTPLILYMLTFLGDNILKLTYKYGN